MDWRQELAAVVVAVVIFAAGAFVGSGGTASIMASHVQQEIDRNTYMQTKFLGEIDDFADFACVLMQGEMYTNAPFPTTSNLNCFPRYMGPFSENTVFYNVTAIKDTALRDEILGVCNWCACECEENETNFI